MFLPSFAQPIHIVSLRMPDTARGGKGGKGGKVLPPTANSLDTRDLTSMVTSKGSKPPVQKQVKKEEGIAAKITGVVRPPKIAGGMAANKGDSRDGSEHQVDVAILQDIVIAAANAAASAAAAAASEAVVHSFCRAYNLPPPVLHETLGGNAHAVPHTPPEASPARSRAPSPLRMSSTKMCSMNEQWKCNNHAIRGKAGWLKSRSGWKQLCPECMVVVREQQSSAVGEAAWASDESDG